MISARKRRGSGLDAVAADLADLDLFAVVDDVGEGVAVVQLQALRFVEGGAQADRDVAGHVVAADRQHGEVARGALVVNDHRGGARSDLHQAHPQVDLLGGEDAFACGEARAHHVFDVEARSVDALDHVLDRGLGAGDDVGFHLEAVAGHADRVAHAVLAVHRVGAGDHMDHLAVGGDADRAGGLDDAVHVLLADLVVGARHRDDARGVLGGEVSACEGDDHGFDALAGHALRGHGGGLDGGDGFFEVDHHALAEAVGGGLAHADDVEGGAGVVRFGDHHGDAACAEV